MASSSAFANHPKHKVTLQHYEGLVEIWFGDVKIASTQNALEMSEANYSLVYYLPFDDCVSSHFHKTQQTTYCPFKGNASYWSLTVDTEHQDNSVWGYEEPYDEVSQITNHVAFYADKVDIRFP